MALRTRGRMRLAIFGLGLAAALLAAMALERPLLEEWHLRKLDSPHPRERSAAAERLGEMRSTRAIPALVREATRGEAPHYGERFQPVFPIADAAASALVEIGPPAIPALLDLFKREDREAIADAADLLGRISPNGTFLLPYLLAMIADLDALGPRKVAVALVAIGLPAVPAVLAALEHDDPDLRRNGTRVLTGDLLYADSVIGALVVPVLTRLLADEVPSVREAAAEALASIEAGRMPVGTDLGKSSGGLR